MFTITERDHELARKQAELDKAIQDEFRDVLLGRHPLRTAPAAEFIVGSSLERVLEERTRLLRYRYCKGVNAERGVHVLVTKPALWAEVVALLGSEVKAMGRDAVRLVIRRLLSDEIKVKKIRGPIQHGDSDAGSLALPGHEYYSFYLHY